MIEGHTISSDDSMLILLPSGYEEYVIIVYEDPNELSVNLEKGTFQEVVDKYEKIEKNRETKNDGNDG